MTTLPSVVVVGRPNVGKSSLVNRFVGRRVAIVEETPGVTRDRHDLEVEWAGRTFTVIDTGGWLSMGDSLQRKISSQAEQAMMHADLVLFVLDTEVGMTEEDQAVASYLRRLGRPVLVVANKVDSATREPDAWSFSSLGWGDPFPVSALHGRRAGDLLDEIVLRLPEEAAEEPLDNAVPDEPLVPAVTLVGRPNVGKSTLFNRLVGEERSVTHDLPGTTTDAIDTLVETPEGTLRFVDTAGLRRRALIGQGHEYYSLVRALKAVDASDAALLVLDVSVGVTHQDQRLAERIDAAGSPIVIVANKWDLLDTQAKENIRLDVADRLGFISYAPLLTVSALTGFGVHRLLPAIAEALGASARRIPTRALNVAIQEAQRLHPAPGAKVLYATQGAVDPPTVTLFSTGTLPPTWLRYLERSLRERFALGPSPLEMRVRRRDGGGHKAGSYGGRR